MTTAILDTIRAGCSESSVLGDQLNIVQDVDIITVNQKQFYTKLNVLNCRSTKDLCARLSQKKEIV